MGEPIAERELTVKRPPGIEQKVTVRLWAPEREERGGYACRAEIDAKGEEPIQFSGEGADAFQAITFALCRIPMRLIRLDESGELSLEWERCHPFPPGLLRPVGSATPAEGYECVPIGIADTWAERVLEFTPSAGGESSGLFVKLGRPYTRPGMGGAWSVQLEIHEGFKEPLISHATGDDSFEAMEFAMRQIAILLKNWEERGKIAWGGEPGHWFNRPDLK
jgi:hypothetical protein